MNFDEILRRIGEFGTYQKFQFFLLCFPVITSSWICFNMVFVVAKQQHRCNIPEFNETAFEETSGKNYSQEFLEKMITSTGDSCTQYKLSDFQDILKSPNYNLSKNTLANLNMSVEPCQNGYVYQDPDPRITVITDFDLVCDRKWLVSNIKSVFMFGRFVGTVFFGQVSDRFGRRLCFFLTIGLVLLTGIIVTLAKNLWLFIFLYFLQGVSQVGIYGCCFIIAMEIIGPKYRMGAGFLLHIVFSFGLILLAGVSYLIRDWSHLELMINLPCIFYIVYWWLLPESVRWLISRKRFDEVDNLIEKIARMNKVNLPAGSMEELKNSAVEEEANEVAPKTYTVIDLLRTWKQAMISLNVWWSWFVNGMLYYGLSMNSVEMDGDPYLNFCLSALVEIPAYLLCIFLLSLIGRLKPLFGFMVLGGIMCITATVIPSNLTWLKLMLATIGKFGATAAFGIVYIMSAEIFPTVVRNLGVGVATLAAGLGGAIAPFVLEFPGPWPLVVLGLVSMFTGILVIFALPETKDMPLPQTIEDSMHNNRSDPSRVSPKKLIYKKANRTLNSEKI